MTFRLMRGLVACEVQFLARALHNDPKGRIHNMEKYAKLLKGLEMCAGPECCKDGCPYYNTTTGGMTCRARLLNDAAAAIANEEAGSETLQELLHNAEAERDNLHADVDNLEAAASAMRTELDGLRIEVERLTENNKILRQRQGKTDQPSVWSHEVAEGIGKMIKEANYQRGRADALAEIVERCSFGGGCRHE